MLRRLSRIILALAALAVLAPLVSAASVTALSILAEAGTQQSVHTPQLIDEAGGWTFQASRNSDGGVTVRVSRGSPTTGYETWNLGFRPPTGAALTVGNYDPCLRAIGSLPGLPSMMVEHSSYATLGYQGSRFAVREIRFNGNTVEALHIVFEQLDGPRGEAIFGELWFRADAPPPGAIGVLRGAVDSPLALDLVYPGAASYSASGLPAGLSLSESGALRGLVGPHGTYFVAVTGRNAAGPVAAGTVAIKLPPPRSATGLTVRGEPGELITRGQNYDFAAGDGVFSYNIRYVAGGPSNGVECLYIDGRNPVDRARWELSFTGPGGARLVPGRYEDAGDSGAGGGASMSITGNQLSVGQSTRSFEVHEIEYGPSNLILRFSVSFSQYHPLTGTTLRGELRHNASQRITSAPQASAQRGSAFRYQAAANNAPTSFSAQGLPAGLSIDPATGLISGTPLEAGYFYPAITARGPGGTAVLALVLSVGPLPPRMVARAAATGRASTPFSYRIQAENEVLAYNVEGEFSFLPTGLALDARTGVISGIPTVAGVSNLTVRATNATGSATQQLALTIEAQSRQLSNVSTRAQAGPSGQEVIAGFVIEGPVPKPVSVRALGPSLGGYLPNVGDLLADPTLELRDAQGQLLASNDDWNDVEAGTSPVNLQHPKEAALSRTLAPGAYTVVIRGNTPASGIALAEVYDGNLHASQLVNLSTRGWVGTGDRVMIAGFVISPYASTRVLIRAVGPSLTAYGVANVLANPTLEVRDSFGQLVASSDDWRAEASASAIAATPFAPVNDREPALLLDLPYGSYTAIVRGKDGATGNAIVEVYKLPGQ